MKEIIEKRNLNTKHFDNENGTFTMDTHIGHIHYQDKQNEKLENVDCRFLPTDYGWEMRKNNYELEIPSKSDDWFKFINSFGYDSRGIEQIDEPNEIVAIRPLNIKSVSGKSINRKGWKGKGIILYKNAYEKDIDLEVMVRNTGFVKEVVINKKPVDLSQDLEFSFEIDIGDLQVKPKKADFMDLRDEKIKKIKPIKEKIQRLEKENKIREARLENKKLVELQKNYEDDLERKTWDKESILETSESIILQKFRKTWFRKFDLKDSKGNHGIIKVRLENKAGKIILTKVLDKTFLENAVYPVRTDTTTSYYTGCGDSWMRNRDANYTTAHDSATADTVETTSDGSNESTWHGQSAGTYYIDRAYFPVNTGGLPDDASISAAKYYFYFEVFSSPDADGVVMVDAPFNSAGAVDTDYNDFGTVAWTDMLSAPTADQYNYFTLNATGRSNISKTSWTYMGIRWDGDIDSDSGRAAGVNYFEVRYCDYVDTGSDPYLSVTYTSAAGAPMTTNKGYW